MGFGFFSWVYFVGVIIFWGLLVVATFIYQVWWLMAKWVFGGTNHRRRIPTRLPLVDDKMGDLGIFFNVFFVAVIITLIAFLVSWLVVKIFGGTTSLIWWYWKKVLTLDD